MTSQGALILSEVSGHTLSQVRIPQSLKLPSQTCAKLNFQEAENEQFLCEAVNTGMQKLFSSEGSCSVFFEVNTSPCLSRLKNKDVTTRQPLKMFS